MHQCVTELFKFKDVKSCYCRWRVIFYGGLRDLRDLRGAFWVH